MRALENNLKIGTFEIKTHTFSVNTPKDLSLVKKLMRKDKYFKKFYEKKKKSSYNFDFDGVLIIQKIWRFLEGTKKNLLNYSFKKYFQFIGNL